MGHLNKSIKTIVYNFLPAFGQKYFKLIEKSPIGYRLAKGAFWSMIGALISRGLMLVASITVARILGKLGFGELGMVQSTIGMFSAFAGFGLGITATKYVAEYRKTDPAKAGQIIGLSGIVAIITGGLMAISLLVIAPWLAIHTLNLPQLGGVLRLGAIILFFGALNGAQTGALAGFEAFKTIAQVNLFVGLISFPILICGAYFGGLTGTVWALATNLFFNWLLNHLALRKEAHRYAVPFTLRNCSYAFPILWKYSLPAFLGAAMVGPMNWACNALLVNRPNGYEEMGILNASYQWDAILLFLPGLLGQVMLPVISERFGQNETKQVMKTMILSVKTNALLVIPFVFLVCFISPFIMGLYGDGFKSGWLTLNIILVSTSLLAIQIPIGQIIAASGKMWVAFTMNMGWAIAFFLGTLFFINQGSRGLAIARAIAYAFHAMWSFGFAIWLIRKEVRR